MKQSNLNHGFWITENHLAPCLLHKKKTLGVSMEFIEWLYYESLPFLYAGLSGFAFLNHDSSKLVAVSAVVLAFCSYAVLSKRYHYRVFQSRYNHKMRI